MSEPSEDVKKGIDELMGLEPASTPPPAEPPTETPPSAEPPAEPPVVPPVESQKGNEPPVETPSVVTPPVETPPVTPPPPVDPRDAELATLRSTVEDMRKMLEQMASQVGKPVTHPADQPPAEPAAPEIHKFIEKEEDLDKALNTADDFNKLLSGVVAKAQEGFASVLPQLVIGLADQVVTRKMAVAEFFNANKDLVGNRAYVGVVANELAAAHPDWSMEKVIEGLAPEVRNRLRLGADPSIQPPVVTPPAEPPATPAFVSRTGARPSGGGDELTRIQKGIEELIKDI